MTLGLIKPRAKHLLSRVLWDYAAGLAGGWLFPYF